MLSNKYPINKENLCLFGIMGNPENEILKRVQSFTEAELKKQAQDLRPFLFDEQEADLLENAHQVIPLLLEKYRLT